MSKSRISPDGGGIVFKQFDQSDCDFENDDLKDQIKVLNKEIRQLQRELLNLTNEYKKLKRLKDGGKLKQ